MNFLIEDMRAKILRHYEYMRTSVILFWFSLTLFLILGLLENHLGNNFKSFLLTYFPEKFIYYLSISWFVINLILLIVCLVSALWWTIATVAGWLGTTVEYSKGCKAKFSDFQKSKKLIKQFRKKFYITDYDSDGKETEKMTVYNHLIDSVIIDFRGYRLIVRIPEPKKSSSEDILISILPKIRNFIADRESNFSFSNFEKDNQKHHQYYLIGNQK